MRYLTVRVGVISALVIVVLTSCATSPEDCDPNNDSVFRGLVCQKAYKERQTKFKREVEEMNMTTKLKRQEQVKLQQQLEDAGELRQEVEAKSREVETEIERLWNTNLIKESEYQRLQRVLITRNKEWQELASEVRRIEEGEENSEGIQDTIAELNEEKQELENLLKALAQ